MFLLFISTALAGPSTHTDGTHTIVKDGIDVVSVQTADATLGYKAGGSGDILELTGPVSIDGPVLSLGSSVWLDRDARKPLTVAFKDNDRSLDVALDDINAWYDPLPKPIHLMACPGGGGFGLQGTLWSGDGGHLAVEQEDGAMTIWTAPTEANPDVTLVGAAVFPTAQLAKGGVITVVATKAGFDVVVSTEGGEETAREPLAFCYQRITWSFTLPEIDDEVICGALLEFQIPEK